LKIKYEGIQYDTNEFNCELDEDDEEVFEDEKDYDDDDDEQDIDVDEVDIEETIGGIEYHKNRGSHLNNLTKPKAKPSDNLSIIIEKFKGNSSKLMQTIDQLDEVLENESNSNLTRSRPVQKSNFNQNKALSKYQFSFDRFFFEPNYSIIFSL